MFGGVAERFNCRMGLDALAYRSHLAHCAKAPHSLFARRFGCADLGLLIGYAVEGEALEQVGTRHHLHAACRRTSSANPRNASTREVGSESWQFSI